MAITQANIGRFMKNLGMEMLLINHCEKRKFFSTQRAQRKTLKRII
jgi:triosephosphate isomerase